MSKARYLAPVMLGLLLLLTTFTGCGLEVKDAAGARDAVLEYLREQYPENAPDTGLKWQEEDATPVAPVEFFWVTQFTSDGLTVKVSFPIGDPDIYTTTITSVQSVWHWQGAVKPDGTITELSPLTEMSEAWSRNIAEEFVRNSPTFTYDGIEETLELTETLMLRCPFCWEFTFEFDCLHAGYGNREGEVLAQVITHHTAVITIDKGEITSSIMDEEWDMQWQWKSPYQLRFIDFSPRPRHSGISAARRLAL